MKRLLFALVAVCLFCIAASRPPSLEDIIKEGSGSLNIKLLPEAPARVPESVQWVKENAPELFENLPEEANWSLRLDIIPAYQYGVADPDTETVSLNVLDYLTWTSGDLRSIILHEIVHVNLFEQGVRGPSYCKYLYHEILATVYELKFEEVLNPSQEIIMSNLLNYEKYNYEYRSRYCDTWFAPIPKLS